MELEKIKEIRRHLRETGRFMAAKDLAWGNAGNISARVDSDRFLITASGTGLGNLEEDDFVVCSLDDGGAFEPGKKPSKELPMHRVVYQERPDVNAILHASPVYSLLIACSPVVLPSNWFVEDMYYLERIGRVPYYHPGSQALAEGVRQQAGKANILLLENHGVLVYDTSLREALMALQTLEMVCRLFVTARSGNIPINELPDQQVRDFLEKSGYRPRRQWGGV